MNSLRLTFSRVKQVEFSIGRVITWSLIFTNAYFLSFMISRLLG